MTEVGQVGQRVLNAVSALMEGLKKEYNMMDFRYDWKSHLQLVKVKRYVSSMKYVIGNTRIT